MENNDHVRFYAAPGAITNIGALPDALFDGLPRDVRELCAVTRGLIIHEFMVSAYGLDAKAMAARGGELELRTAEALVSAIVAIDRLPLATPRPPDRRLVGNCRQFSVVTCALLRRAGVPARARAGFGSYFEPGKWLDHWIVEWWDEPAHRWVRADPQLDDVQRKMFGFEFDPLDMPGDKFRDGTESWLACRRDGDDPNRYGILDMHGLWFIGSSALRDLAALNKVEAHTWDTWGAADGFFGNVNDEQIALIDRVAAAVASDDLEAIRRVYAEPGLVMTGTVTSHRTQRPVKLPVDA